MNKSPQTLYLHCGYHKTGSSFLQTMFARSRDLLKANSIYYPFSERELDMIQGNISPGNGQQLSNAVRSGDIDLAYQILENEKKEGLKNDCSSILFSSEELFHTFGREGTLSVLCKAANESGYESIEALLYFRDPVSHAMSTYKHRAKNGNHSDIRKWVKNDYETMDLISKYRTYHSEYPINWTCRKYASDSNFMIKSSFKDWLGIETPEIPIDDKVNTSLNLSEIKFIQIIKENYGEAVPYLREAFANIEATHKSKDSHLALFYQSIISEELSKYNDLIGSINSLLPAGEDLVISAIAADRNSHSDQTEITLKQEQVIAVTEALLKAAGSNRMVSRVGVFWKKGVGKVKRRLKTLGL